MVSLIPFSCFWELSLSQNISTLSALKILSIQSNRITTLEDSGLSELKNLEELYISHNGLTKIQGLEGCLKLKTLDVGANKIEKIENVSHLKELEEFWVRPLFSLPFSLSLFIRSHLSDLPFSPCFLFLPSFRQTIIKYLISRI